MAGRLVGEVGLKLVSWEHRQGEIGFVLNPITTGGVSTPLDGTGSSVTATPGNVAAKVVTTRRYADG